MLVNHHADNADTRQHWETVYASQPVEKLDWYVPHLTESLQLIESAAPDKAATIIDVGAGAATLAEDLLLRGYRSISILDISARALDQTRRRLEDTASSFEWIAGDILESVFPEQTFDIWHDRALFHFLTTEAQRDAYVRRAVNALKPGGHIVIGVFGTDGPLKCSGLEVMNYSTESLLAAFGPTVELHRVQKNLHVTPSGIHQPYLFCLLRKAS